MINFERKIQLCCACPIHPRGIAFDGCWFYILQPNSCEIIRLDSDLQPAGSIIAPFSLTALCHDAHLRCFWAATDTLPSHLLRLDPRFKEVQRTRLTHSQSQEGLGGICAIAVSAQCTLALATSQGLAHVQIDPSSGAASTLCIEAEAPCATALAVCDSISILLCCTGACQRLLFYKGGKLLEECALPLQWMVKGMVAHAGPKGSHCCRLQLLIAPCGCSPCILECTLGFGSCCPPQCAPSSPCDQVLLSMALMQTSFAHILDAEAEKLRRIMETCDDLDALLKVNQSIQRTVVHITHLEQVQYEKLDLLKDMCCLCPCSMCE